MNGSEWLNELNEKNYSISAHTQAKDEGNVLGWLVAWQMSVLWWGLLFAIGRILMSESHNWYL